MDKIKIRENAKEKIHKKQLKKHKKTKKAKGLENTGTMLTYSTDTQARKRERD